MSMVYRGGAMKISPEIIQSVWEMAETASQMDPDCVRRDCFGAWIYRQAFGDRGSAYGWEIDHIIPPASGGDDGLDNLRPMQWQNSHVRREGQLRCMVTALGGANAFAGRS